MKTGALEHQIFIVCANGTGWEHWAAATIPPAGRHEVTVTGDSLREVLTKVVSGIFWDRYPYNTHNNDRGNQWETTDGKLLPSSPELR